MNNQFQVFHKIVTTDDDSDTEEGMVEFSGGTMQPHHSGLRPVFGNLIGTSSSHGPAFHLSIDDSDIEDGIVMQDSSGIRLLQRQLHLGDDDASVDDSDIEGVVVQDSSGIRLRQRQLHLGDDDFARTIPIEIAEQEKAMHGRTVEDEVRQLGVFYLNGRAKNTNSGRLKFFNGYEDHGTLFEQTYRCYPASFIGKPEIESGDKIIMPRSAVDRVASLHIDDPLLFELRNAATKRVSHCGVLEFVAEEGMIYMPYAVLDRLWKIFL